MEQSVSELTNLLQRWEDKMTTPNYNPIPTLIKMNDKCGNCFKLRFLCPCVHGTETKKYRIKDTDNFDDHHPSRIDPNCVLGKMYEVLFRRDSLMNKLLMDYLKEHHSPRQTEDDHNLNVAVCRLIMNLIPGLETTVVFESGANDRLIQRLFTWAENSNDPLQTYATGLLASFMELTDTATNFKDNNNKLVPIILDRLHSYYTKFCEETEINQSTQPYQNTNSEQPNDNTDAPSSKRKKREENGICSDINSSYPESIASNWIQIYSPTLTTKLVYCLKYLVPTGEYQEFLSHTYGKNALNLVMKIINSSEKQNGYITFEALKYLTALLCHKNFVTEFIDSHGLQVLVTLMTIKTPITHVDTIRGLASRALAGLARSESVRQIIRKLPLFNSGQLQGLMENPVLQEKRQEHVTFQKYALELIELVSEEKKSNGASLTSLENINRANVVAQTEINYKEQQFHFLLYQHYMKKGWFSTVESIARDTNLNISEKNLTPFTYISYCCNRSYRGGISPVSSRHMIQFKKPELANSSNGPLGAVFRASGRNSTPKRLNIIRRSKNLPKPEPEQEGMAAGGMNDNITSGSNVKI
ncbi:protein mahjong-like [Metopolophium dirhodum]|uniref:protein mahjong-like n=1 Tax=Metopolophium dirhodum TaxID=44670 RepID=UPI002990738D|nr:protein mahjong-like [Metopolophium dirhodum]